jgi:hypothetical protein
MNQSSVEMLQSSPYTCAVQGPDDVLKSLRLARVRRHSHTEQNSTLERPSVPTGR